MRLDHAGNIVILTGAGVSAESGLSTFRDSGGLWENHDPMTIATPEAFARDPGLVYRFYNARRLQLNEVDANPAHRAIARLQREHRGDVFLVTQNVDDLHERGGSSQVCHMHGELRSAWCLACGSRYATREAFDAATACERCAGRGGLRPDIVWFGEMPYEMDLIERKLAACDLFIAIGTSGTVYPAAGFVRGARAFGAYTIEVNRDSSETSSVFHQHRVGLAGELVGELVEEILVQPPST
ncbi:NAD-dependent deacylase [Haliea sp. E17]|uniref:NAD-dependent deacylase n=1 Tax=Haliea sp. E17 TaxID=3401576 RepID=UPI003AAE0C33